jgi:hypothetical protein
MIKNGITASQERGILLADKFIIRLLWAFFVAIMSLVNIVFDMERS